MFQFFNQLDAMDCGPTCLRMVAKHHGRTLSAQELREASEIGKDGVNLLGIAQAAEKVGFKTLGVKVSFEKLKQDSPLPCIVHWSQNHFIVVYKIKKDTVYVADPARGLLKYSTAEFESQWATTIVEGKKTGVALLLEPTERFYEEDGFSEKNKGKTFCSLFNYFFRFKSLIVQLGLGLLVASMIQLVLPFLTQSVVDTGIQTRNLNFIYLVLAAQLMLFVGRMSVDFLRSWILLHISTRINLSILSDFLSKLLKLPVSYFESKQTGDILQRIGDHRRIESFLTGTSLNVLFSMFNLVIFSVVLVYYNLSIFGVFVVASVLYSIWIVLFLKYRRTLDHKRFALNSKNQSSLIQMVQSVPELKLNNATLRKRWDWENLQVQEFKLSMKGLALQQYQQVGALFINEGKNIFITFLAATAVVNGQMTLGAMMAMQYIIGQLNSPVEQLVGFVQHLQDAKLSLERLNEVHSMDDEEPAGQHFIKTLPEDKSIHIENLSYTYPGAGNDPVLTDVSLSIPEGKVTAIVGSSGSGKTTLLKLLLKFVVPQKGNIKISNTQLKNISHDYWRGLCGTVMQDGYIFSDTIANNISISEERADIHKLLYAVKVANIQGFIEELPLSYNTKIGTEGNGVSQGQKQRLLIARAVYKNPEYLFFDEATNALDAENERIIMDNLEEFFKGKTVVVVAHRLSTVKNADQIIVLEKGRVVETGTHQQLSKTNGRYYELVKNQLELGA
ncbi:ATP-binding cassette domain-containing protein [Emticicia sp. CRIBPO]|uniref:peptidase domain-containing ABC transporter n=1 Tax=Emticicia sp. CRIBPO TaxID=2683258 RepID=UPI001411E1C3|nr:peptidase domain-containing ABC transporter [Emticicia sp. CRIBPO]NBA88713.1 ATP-binding cassette domain-containing protein [Emticicia sp. CRIBPO]